MFKHILRYKPLPRQKYVINFKDSEIGLPSLLTRSDKGLGGFSTVDLSVTDNRGSSNNGAKVPATVKDDVNREPEVYGTFHGDLSLDIPENRPEIVRLGFAMFRTKDLEPSMLGLGSSEFHDWSGYNQLALRVRGDYRKYFVNIQADTPLVTDLYQHRLFLKSPGQWEIITIPFSSFILTNGGVIQQQEQLDTSRVRSVGIGLIDGQYGLYRLDVEWVKVIAGDVGSDIRGDDSAASFETGETRLSMND